MAMTGSGILSKNHKSFKSAKKDNTYRDLSINRENNEINFYS